MPLHLDKYREQHPQCRAQLRMKSLTALRTVLCNIAIGYDGHGSKQRTRHFHPNLVAVSPTSCPSCSTNCWLSWQTVEKVIASQDPFGCSPSLHGHVRPLNRNSEWSYTNTPTERILRGPRDYGPLSLMEAATYLPSTCESSKDPDLNNPGKNTGRAPWMARHQPPATLRTPRLLVPFQLRVLCVIGGFWGEGLVYTYHWRHACMPAA